MFAGLLSVEETNSRKWRLVTRRSTSAARHFAAIQRSRDPGPPHAGPRVQPVGHAPPPAALGPAPRGAGPLSLLGGCGVPRQISAPPRTGPPAAGLSRAGRGHRQSTLAVGLEGRPLGLVVRPPRLADPSWGRRGCSDLHHHGKMVAPRGLGR